METDTPFTTDDVDGMVDSIRAAVAFDDADAALELCDAVLAIRPDHLETLFVQATVLHELRRPDDARSILEQAAAHHGDVSGIWQRLGDAALECGDGERAVEAYRQWQRLGGPVAAAETALAVACLIDLDADRSRRHASAAMAAGGVALTAEVAEALAGLDDQADVEAAAGWWLCSLGAIQPGIELLRASLGRRNQPTTQRRLGVALMLDGRSADAALHLGVAVEQVPDESDWRAELGTTQLAAGSVDAASASFEAVLAEVPDHVAAIVGTGQVGIARNDPAAAMAVADGLLDRNVASADGWVLRAQALSASGRYLEALVSAEHAIVATPDERRPWLLAADAAEAADHSEVARAYRARGSIQLSGSLGVAESQNLDSSELGLAAELHELDRLVVADPRVRSIYASRALIADRLFVPRRAVAYLDAAIERGVVEATEDVNRDRAKLLATIQGVDDSTADTEQPWTPTHCVPPTGLAAFVKPTNEQSPAAELDGDLAVAHLEDQGAWAHVRCENGWECWVDAKLLVPMGTPWRPTHRVPAAGLISYVAPSSTPQQIGRIGPGLSVELISEYGGWAHVRFENAWSCWVNRPALEDLR